MRFENNIFYDYKLNGKYCSADNYKHVESITYDNINNISSIIIDSTYLSKYQVSGNDIVLPAYEYAKEQLDKAIEYSDDGIVVNKRK